MAQRGWRCLHSPVRVLGAEGEGCQRKGFRQVTQFNFDFTKPTLAKGKRGESSTPRLREVTAVYETHALFREGGRAPGMGGVARGLAHAQEHHRQHEGEAGGSQG